MYPSKREGFTLIELLTVIAIIAILAGMIFAGFGRVREMAKFSKADNAFNQFRNEAGAYFTQHQSFPVPIGGVLPDKKDNYNKIFNTTLTVGSDPTRFWSTFQTKPYTVALGVYESDNYTDPFGRLSMDSDLSGTISLLEYFPIGYRVNSVDAPEFPLDLPPLGNNGNAMTGMLSQVIDNVNPIYYIAVNKRHAKIAERFWTKNNDPYGDTWNWNDIELRSVVLPTTYDAYVLISVGPGGNTAGLLADSPALLSNARNIGESYMLANLRAFYLATRDWNDDKLPDLTYEGKSARDLNYSINNQTAGQWNKLPNTIAPLGMGPYATSYGWN